MKCGAFAARLFDRPVAPLRLNEPLRCLAATLTENAVGQINGITCGKLRVVGTNLIPRLCRLLVDSGAPDCTLQLCFRDRSPAAFIMSFHATAARPRCRDGPPVAA